ncbi:hypothetical protein PORY_000013 [Pneumocystis oryctolagi]|uniref:Uncharacterized protein n=1 Tax=Pneumocystis oryctolagi TaxID=42067 RepID=A0ACB7CG12_9ASCO|nr:hypothetical protein PORY_000013 [Pneumocystis oryctolagi]
MQSPINTPRETVLLKDGPKEGFPKDSLSKDCVLCDYGVTDCEKADDFSKCVQLKTPEASQSSEDQRSGALVSILDSQMKLCETSRQRRRRRRTAPQELAILEEEYLKDEKPNLLNRERIAAKINSVSTTGEKMGSREIQIWFQNKRQAMRRQSSHFTLSNTRTETVSGSLATKQSCYWDVNDVRLQQYIKHKILSFKRIPSLRLSTNEGGKAQVMFNVLRENKNSYDVYKDNGKSEKKRIQQFTGKENAPPVREKNAKKEMDENEMEECARSLMGLARGW